MDVLCCDGLLLAALIAEPTAFFFGGVEPVREREREKREKREKSDKGQTFVPRDSKHVQQQQTKTKKERKR